MRSRFVWKHASMFCPCRDPTIKCICVSFVTRVSVFHPCCDQSDGVVLEGMPAGSAVLHQTCLNSSRSSPSFTKWHATEHWKTHVTCHMQRLVSWALEARKQTALSPFPASFVECTQVRKPFLTNTPCVHNRS
jgi:hypothetical protein